MKKVIYYYAYLDGNYMFIVQDQLSKFFYSGLYDECERLELQVASPEKTRIDWIKDLVSSYSKINLTIIEIDKSEYHPDFHEMKIALQNLQKDAELNEGYYCWVHAKGVTNFGINIDLWRMSMDNVTIFDWRKNIKMLDEGFDAVGPNLRYDTFLGYYPHFSGAYFWAKSNYIKTLDKTYLINLENKYLGEFWIGSNHEGKLGSSFECGHEAPYAILTNINKYIK